MSGAFIHALPKVAQVWSAKAIAGIIVADGVVTDGELEILRESIGFLEDAQLINEIVSMVKDRQKPKLEVLKADRKLSSQILLSLVIVALTDGKISGQEVEYVKYVAGKLGFEPGYANHAIKWGKDYAVLNRKKQDLIAQGERSKPMYINY